jgi:uncharacterized paraquat-inducible protein A
MNTEANVVCPNCGVILPTTGLAPGVLVQCSRCGKQFNLGDSNVSEPATSGKAVTSLVLGLIPIPLLTGIPAIILGIWALVDIRRRAGQLRGSGMAACGILFGSLCTLICVPLTGAVVLLAQGLMGQFNFTDDPEQAAAIASHIAEIDVPEGLQPIGAADVGFIGWRMAIYGDRPNNPTTMIMLMKFPAFMAESQQQMEQQMTQQMQAQHGQGVDIDESRIVTYTIRGQPVQVSEGFGTDAQTGQRARQYVAMIPEEQGPLMILLITHDPPEGESDMPEMEDTAVRLTEEQVQHVFESIE